MRLHQSLRILAVAIGAAALLALPSCSSSGGGTDDDAAANVIDLAGAEPADFEVTPSSEAITVTDAAPGTELQVLNREGEPQINFFSVDGRRADSGIVDDEGNLVFARVPAGDGYQVVTVGAARLAASDPVTVDGVYAQPPQSLYDSQTLDPGLHYIETRDGTTLAAMVRMPGAPEDGPYPTVINYSGYDSANPNGSSSSIAQFADLYGYATVSVNVRGTGCSGGTFSFFEASQVSDAYDAVEAVAAQDWVLHGKPGMIGISYAGISQLFAASTQPPHLAAIAPMSVLDSVWPAVLYPGGIYNNGFARNWILNVQDGAEPYGQGWEQFVVDEGGEEGAECAANQELRSQNPNIELLSRAYPFYDPVVGDPLTPSTFADRIDVPVFLTGAWQDEQTGGHFPALIDHLTGTPDLHVTMYNGTHGDSLTPENVQRWFEFLDFYVAEKIPEIPPIIRAGAPVAFVPQFGEGEYVIPPDRFTDAASYEEALADYQADPDIRILYENGAATDIPGIPGSTFVESYASWPPPDVEATPYYFQPDGGLGIDEPTVDDGEADSAASFDYDQSAGSDRTVPGGFTFASDPGFDWQPVEEGSAASYVSDPFDDTVVMAGTASADLFIESTADDTDLEVTITEVRPDGEEIYVQNGWLRASHRALDEDASTELRPVHTDAEADAEPLPSDEFTAVRVEMFPFAHVFHAGSSIRIMVDSPGGNRPEWEFESLDGADVVNTVAQSANHPSSIVLPILPGDHDAPSQRPDCEALRGQPCRDFQEYTNTPGGDS